jgi:hypothetical protein
LRADGCVSREPGVVMRRLGVVGSLGVRLALLCATLVAGASPATATPAAVRAASPAPALADQLRTLLGEARADEARKRSAFAALHRYQALVKAEERVAATAQRVELAAAKAARIELAAARVEAHKRRTSPMRADEKSGIKDIVAADRAAARADIAAAGAAKAAAREEEAARGAEAAATAEAVANEAAAVVREEEANMRAEQARMRAELARMRAELARMRAEQARARAEQASLLLSQTKADQGLAAAEARVVSQLDSSAAHEEAVAVKDETAAKAALRDAVTAAHTPLVVRRKHA